MEHSLTHEEVQFPPRVIAPRNPLRFPQNILKLLTDNLTVVPRQAYERFVVLAEGPPRMAFVTGPDHIKSILQDSWGNFPRGKLKTRILKPLFGNSLGQLDHDDWKWQRRAAAPLFRHSELEKYGTQVSDVAHQTLLKWSGDVTKKSDRRKDTDMLQVGYRIISNTILSGFPEELKNDIEFGHQKYFENMNWWIAYSMFGLPTWMPRPGGRQMRSYQKNIRGNVLKVVEQRRMSDQNNDDLISRWMQSSDPNSGKTLSNEQLRDNVISLLVSGYETVAMTLAWALFLVAKHPDWQTAIMQETELVFGSGAVEAANIDQLKVTRQVINETLRLYPTSPFISRDVVEDVEFEGVCVPAGTSLFIPVYALHRHKELWSNPDEFQPGRFEDSRMKSISKYQFIPFGAGPRVCIGASFAMMELSILLATFVRGAEFKTIDDLVPQPIGRSILFAKNGISLEVYPR